MFINIFKAIKDKANKIINPKTQLDILTERGLK